MAELVTVTLDRNGWGCVMEALNRSAYDIAERELRRTGGRLFASGGKSHAAVDQMLAIRREIDRELNDG